MLADLPLARSAVDVDAISRGRPDLLDELLAEASTRVLLVHRGLVAAGAAGLELVPAADLPPGPWEAGELLYLGKEAGAGYLALVLPEALGAERDLDGVPVEGDAPLVALISTLSFVHLRDVGTTLSDRDAGLATTAVALAAWHARNPRCPRCGEATTVTHAGWVRRCVVDRSDHYPRTDTAVIMAVVDDADRILLARATHWPERRFSTLAGYVEPGESLEAAVRREVFEETGIDVGEVRYEGSQPWPFPCSLMTGFRASVRPGAGADVRVDGVEIAEGRFFTRAELGEQVAAGTIRLPSGTSIARALIEDWYGAALPR
ncbi:NAD(+) diphosphatase [Georgenia wangjunii]|uniref:NAD(+) diphosphatase n=1 Tax=Georgenia wangjunii TaxID=3117730 RepID=UPI002F25FA2F